jgi:hypothetical protein
MMADQHFMIVPPIHTASRKRTVYQFKETHIFYYIGWMVEAILASRFLLNLFAANPASWFAQLIETASGPFIAPFAAILPITAFGWGIFEWPVLLAMAVYLFVAYALFELINALIARSP